MSKHFHWQGEDLILHCLLQPRASSNEIVGVVDGTPVAGTSQPRLKIRITAPPVDGKANQHLVALLSRWFGSAKGKITIVRGETGRQKTVLIQCPSRLPPEADIAGKTAGKESG